MNMSVVIKNICTLEKRCFICFHGQNQQSSVASFKFKLPIRKFEAWLHNLRYVPSWCIRLANFQADGCCMKIFSAPYQFYEIIYCRLLVGICRKLAKNIHLLVKSVVVGDTGLALRMWGHPATRLAVITGNEHVTALVNSVLTERKFLFSVTSDGKVDILSVNKLCPQIICLPPQFTPPIPSWSLSLSHL